MSTCVFAIGPFSEEGVEEEVREAFQHAGYQVTGHRILVAECKWADVPRLASVLDGAPYVSHTADCPVETRNALTDYWSRKQHPEWRANEDWFQAHKHEYKRGEFIVVQQCALKLRTRDIRECQQFLLENRDSSTAMHEMTDDGVELLYHV
jgi:hypothetical protein